MGPIGWQQLGMPEALPLRQAFCGGPQACSLEAWVLMKYYPHDHGALLPSNNAPSLTLSNFLT